MLMDAIFANALVSVFVNGMCCVAQERTEARRQEQNHERIREVVRQEYEMQRQFDREITIKLANALEAGSTKSSANTSQCESQQSIQTVETLRSVLSRIEHWTTLDERDTNRKISQIRSDLSFDTQPDETTMPSLENRRPKTVFVFPSQKEAVQRLRFHGDPV